MTAIRCVLAAALLVWAAVVPSAQTLSRRVTVVTSKGYTIQGSLRSISLRTVVVDIGGAPITVPMSDVAYVSFTGSLSGSEAGPVAPPSLVERAVASLKRLGSIVESGLAADPSWQSLRNGVERAARRLARVPSDAVRFVRNRW